MKFLNITSALIWGILVVATCSLFAIFSPENLSVLFWVNLLSLILLETVAIGAISVVSRKQFFSVQNVSLAMQACRFAGVGVLVFCVGNLVLLSGISPRWYYAALIIVAVYFCVKMLFLSQGALAQTETLAAQEQRIETKEAQVRSFPSLVSDFRQAARGKENLSAEKKQSAERAVTVFSESVACIPAMEFSLNSRLTSVIEGERERLLSAIEALARADSGSARDALENIALVAGEATKTVDTHRKSV